MPLDSSTGTFTVYPHGEGARIVWHADVEVADPALEEMLSGGYAAAMEALAARIAG